MNIHNTLTRRQLLTSTAASALALSPTFSQAQAAWPTKPLRLVVPFAPGGSSEIVARALAGEMGKTIGQSVFVDNKPGGAGNIAMQEVANATDDHTLILGHIGTLAVNPYIFPKLSYDANKDFTPITLISKVPSLYVVHPDLPVKNLKEFVASPKPTLASSTTVQPATAAQATWRLNTSRWCQTPSSCTCLIAAQALC